MTQLIPEDVVELFESGVSILVGTRDANCLPEATRGVGALVHPDRRRLTVFLPKETSARAVANLRDNGQVAVGFSAALDHRTLQVKGILEEIRDANEDERQVIARYHGAFIEVLYFTGIPRALAKHLTVWPSLAVTFRATDIFHQTPGPNAGALMSSFEAAPSK